MPFEKICVWNSQKKNHKECVMMDYCTILFDPLKSPLNFINFKKFLIVNLQNAHAKYHHRHIIISTDLHHYALAQNNLRKPLTKDRWI